MEKPNIFLTRRLFGSEEVDLGTQLGAERVWSVTNYTVSHSRIRQIKIFSVEITKSHTDWYINRRQSHLKLDAISSLNFTDSVFTFIDSMKCSEWFPSTKTH